MLGRPTLHRPVSTLLADSVGAGLRPDHRPALARRVGQLAGDRHPRGASRGRPTRPGCAAAPTPTPHAVATVRAQLTAHPLTTGLHVAAAVADGLRPGDQLVLGASNPVRDAALVGLNAHGIKVRSNRGVAGIDGTVSTAIGAALAHERPAPARVPRTVALHR